MLLTLERSDLVRRATVRFEGRDFALDPSRAKGQPLAFIGLDLGLKPGPRPIRVEFTGPDGAGETVDESVVLEKRTFKLTRLTLDLKFVVPPAEMLDRIRAEAKIIAAAFGDPSPDWLGDGLFELPHEGLMYFDFGDRRILNGQTSSVHAGVDIEASLGDPVLASNSGRIVLAGNFYYTGNSVFIDHGLGVFTAYFHMSRLRVKTGDLVAKGQTIGDVGSTGRSTGPHLHWSVVIFGSRVDPRSLLRLPLLDWEAQASRD